MKNLFFLFLCLSANTVGAQSIVKQSSTITDVTVYKNGAQIVRLAKSVALPQGKTKVVFTGNTVNIKDGNLRVKTTEGVMITGIATENEAIDAALAIRAAEQKTKLTACENRIAAYRTEEKILQHEEKILLANQNTGGTTAGAKVTDLREMVEYQKAVLQKNYVRREELTHIFIKENELFADLTRQYNLALGGNGAPKTKNIVVMVETKNALNADFLITYTVDNASWSPFYDVRVKDISSPMSIQYQASVEQNSGEDWTNVPLHLSNAEPMQYRNPPELKTWFLETEKKTKKMVDTLISYNPQTYEEKISIVANEYDAETMHAQTMEKQTSLQFYIPVAYTVRSGEASVRMDIATLTVPATYCYYTVPKLRPLAYLKAHVTNWEQYNFMEGRTFLFVDNAFVGEGDIAPFTTGDTLSFALGSDPSIIIQRTKLRDFSKKQFLGNKRTDERTFVTKIRNTKKTPINIVVQDQIPVSTNKELTIENVEAKNATIDPATGKIEWRIDVPPTSEKLLNLHYEAKYLRSERVFLE
jgi:uncharacterized protein (TIGR02231 family)